MECTDLVTHSIDTGEHHHIRPLPRHLPITEQDVEKVDLQKDTRLRCNRTIPEQLGQPCYFGQQKDAVHQILLSLL